MQENLLNELYKHIYNHITTKSVLVLLFVVYSRRRFVVCLTMCHFVLVFFSPFSIAITSLGVERANLSTFRTFVRFVLVWICRFPLPLGVWEGLRFVIVALPGLFSYLFYINISQGSCLVIQSYIILLNQYIIHFRLDSKVSVYAEPKSICIRHFLVTKVYSCWSSSRLSPGSPFLLDLYKLPS